MLRLKPENASEWRLAANRRDDLKSTGPRPSEGKRRVRTDAWKHGRRARTSAEGFLRGRAEGGEHQKKECLFLTNEAVRLLKTKDRENERSRTKPILLMGKLCRSGPVRR